MCDPSLTDVGGRSSEFPSEAEPWREVDVSDVEQKLKGLKMEQEADFSEPEQVQLDKPVLKAGLPSSSTPPSHDADGVGTLPSSSAGDALPSSGDGGGSKHAAVEVEKKKVIAKAAPSSAKKAMEDLKPFLRFAEGKDSDAEPVKPQASALPRASSRAPSLNRSRSKSKAEKSEKDRERRSKTPRSRSRPVSPGSRDRVVGCILGQPELAGFTHELDPAPIYYTSLCFTHKPWSSQLEA